MEQYDPFQEPDAAEWLQLGEAERIDLVQEFHRDAEVEVSEASLHAAVHVLVENQLALGVEPVPATIAKLTRQGLDRHEAIHAVGAVLAEDIYGLLKGEEDTWNQQRYRRRLEKLSAKRWRRGKW